MVEIRIMHGRLTRHVEGSGSLPLHALEPPQPDHLRLFTSGITPPQNTFAGAPKTSKPPSEPKAVLHRTVLTPARSIESLEISSAIETLQTLDTRP
ncbi:unnamed protein product [Eruca vesicaria subsp. sativa]|uniref:Uncharacterized protein n=1 Tax=Eruca vesicaria subsp. sativa TaxID=29727 RepID=A0ABC8M2Y5_ERUVS|nr:unnamed protein product [Eruca vesicaria subsp. sativa]